MTENQNQAPALTLEPAMTRDKVMMEEAVKQQEAAPAAAAEATAEMDTSMLSEADRRAIEEFAQKIDLNNTDHVLLYGSDAQKKIADFSDSALATVRTNDTGEVGEMLVKLVNEIKGFGDSAEKPKGLGGLFWNAKKAVSDMQTKYDKVEVNVDAIASSLEGYQAAVGDDVVIALGVAGTARDLLFALDRQHVRGDRFAIKVFLPLVGQHAASRAHCRFDQSHNFTLLFLLLYLISAFAFDCFL